MKQTITTLLVCIGISTITFAQKSDQDLVKQTVTYYLDGGTNNDYEVLQKAFHKNATMKFIRGEEYKEVNVLEYFKKAMKPGPKQNRKTRIASIDITGNAAQAKIELIYPNASFIDYMNILKVDGEWKIVNKIFSKQK